MSEIRLVVRDADRSSYADRHAAFADRVIAALSADPETIEELDVAIERFIKPDEWSYFRGFRAGDDDTPWDAGVVVIDLAARLIVCESTYSLPEWRGWVQYHDGRCATDVWLGFALSDEWMIRYEARGWKGIAQARRDARASRPPLDARAVLYGDALLEFVARECFAAFRELPNVVGPEDYKDPEHKRHYDLIRQIHASWMMTPRPDLRGETPRQVMMARREHLSTDYQDRKHDWSFLLRCPRPLDAESAAYRFAGFGDHEAVVYYDLVRELLWSCRSSVAQNSSQAIDNFVSAERLRLAALRDQWMKLPYSDFSDRTPESIIENERLRIPEAASPSEYIIDEDCPVCQMHADLDGPTFWNLDGCNMDQDFAFSFHQTLEEWEKEQREWAEMDRHFDLQQAERKRLGIERSPGGEAFDSLQIRLYGVGDRVCDVLADLKMSDEPCELTKWLEQAFEQFRSDCNGVADEFPNAAIEPAISRFAEVVEDILAARPDLERSCGRLNTCLERFNEPLREPLDADASDNLPF